MEFTEDITDADDVLTPVDVIDVILNDEELSIRCMKALDSYAKCIKIGNNQAPIIIFETEYMAFGWIDRWDEGGVM